MFLSVLPAGVINDDDDNSTARVKTGHLMSTLANINRFSILFMRLKIFDETFYVQ